MIPAVSRALAAADVFTAIADPNRRRLLCLLAAGERAVMELVDRVRISQPSISEHLRILRDVGLVRVRRSGRQRIYRIETAPLHEVVDWVGHFGRFWDAKFDNLVRYMAKKRSERGHA